MSTDKITIKDLKLEIDFYEHFISDVEAKNLFKELALIISPVGNKRVCKLFGNEDVVYNVTYFGKTSTKPVFPWFESLIRIRDRITAETGQIYTVCAIQMYPNGNVGINPHRDKEMVKGTMICGLSIGAKRTLSMTKGFTTTEKEHQLKLNSGSLYILKPPTNDVWAHCIKKDTKNNGARYSLTFRNY